MSTAEVTKLQAVQRSLAIAQRVTGSALTEAKKHRSASPSLAGGKKHRRKSPARKPSTGKKSVRKASPKRRKSAKKGK